MLLKEGVKHVWQPGIVRSQFSRPPSRGQRLPDSLGELTIPAHHPGNLVTAHCLSPIETGEGRAKYKISQIKGGTKVRELTEGFTGRADKNTKKENSAPDKKFWH